jgi:hypothetical protein
MPTKVQRMIIAKVSIQKITGQQQCKYDMNHRKSTQTSIYGDTNSNENQTCTPNAFEDFTLFASLTIVVHPTINV